MATAQDVLTIVKAGSLLGNDEAARILGYDPLTLKNSRNTGKLGGVESPRYRKLGRSVRYELESLIEWSGQFSEQTCTRDAGVV